MIPALKQFIVTWWKRQAQYSLKILRVFMCVCVYAYMPPCAKGRVENTSYRR